VGFALVVVLAMLNGIWLADQFARTRSSLIHGLPQRIIAAEQIVRSGQRTLSQQPEPMYLFPIKVSNLSRPDVQAAFPTAPAGAQGLLDAQSHIQVGASDQPFHDIPAPTVTTWGGVTGPVPESGCTIGEIIHSNAFVDAHLTSRGGMVSITSAARTYRTQLLNHGLRGATASWAAAPPGQKTYLASVVADATLRITLPASGAVTVCQGS
jgi:hypothetical protein